MRVMKREVENKVFGTIFSEQLPYAEYSHISFLFFFMLHVGDVLAPSPALLHIHAFMRLWREVS